MPRRFILVQDQQDPVTGPWQSYVFAPVDPGYYTEITDRTQAMVFETELAARIFRDSRISSVLWRVEEL